MDQTYNKMTVLYAANNCAHAMRGERERLLAEWDMRSRLYRFMAHFLGDIRPTYYGEHEQKVAERVAFKAAACIEPNVYLTDDEIDAIKDFWGSK